MIYKQSVPRGAVVGPGKAMHSDAPRLLADAPRLLTRPIVILLFLLIHKINLPNNQLVTKKLTKKFCSTTKKSNLAEQKQLSLATNF